METKFCRVCERDLPLDAFWCNKRSSQGRDTYCKECRLSREIKYPVEPPAERTCRQCQLLKPIAKFPNSKKRRDGKSMVCGTCKSPCARKSSESYARMKIKTRDRNRRVRREQKTKLIALLGGKCADCGRKPGKQWPLDCFDFHHLDSEKKEGQFARRLPNTTSWGWLVNEAKHCVILDATCHRRRHARMKEAELATSAVQPPLHQTAIARAASRAV